MIRWRQLIKRSFVYVLLKDIYSLMRKVIFRIGTIIATQKFEHYVDNIKKNLTAVEDESNIEAIEHAHNIAVIRTQNFVYKVEYEKQNTILKEYNSYRIIMANYPAIFKYLPDCELLDIDGRKYLKIEKLYMCPDQQNIQFALQIFDAFSEYSKKRKIGLSELKEVCKGIDILANLYDHKISITVTEHIQRYLAETCFSIGPVHGDFHSRNILMNKRGCPKIIDLDCFRLLGIQHLDILYYLVELQYSRYGKMWYDTIACSDVILSPSEQTELSILVDDIIDREFLLLYFLDRIGQERLYFNITYPKQACESFIRYYFSGFKMLV